MSAPGRQQHATVTASLHGWCVPCEPWVRDRLVDCHRPSCSHSRRRVRGVGFRVQAEHARMSRASMKVPQPRQGDKLNRRVKLHLTPSTALAVSSCFGELAPVRPALAHPNLSSPLSVGLVGSSGTHLPDRRLHGHSSRTPLALDHCEAAPEPSSRLNCPGHMLCVWRVMVMMITA